MADRFDQVAKAIASGQLTRRQALRRVGIGAGVGLIAILGSARSAFAAGSVSPAACGGYGAACGGNGMPACCAGYTCVHAKTSHCY